MDSKNYTGRQPVRPMNFDEAMDSLRGELGAMPTPDDVETAFTNTALKCLDGVKRGIMGIVVPTRQLNALCVGMEAACSHARALSHAVEHEVPATIACILAKLGVDRVELTPADLAELSGAHKVLRAMMEPSTGTLIYALADAEAAA